MKGHPSNSIKLMHILRATYSSQKVRITSDRFPGSISVAYDSTMNSVADCAIAALQRIGFKVIGYGENDKRGYYICTDTWISLAEAMQAHKANKVRR